MYKWERERERESTIMEEKRGWMGRKAFWRSAMVGRSSRGTCDSKMPRIEIDRTELLKYCPVGLTGSASSSSSCFNWSIVNGWFVFSPPVLDSFTNYYAQRVVILQAILMWYSLSLFIRTTHLSFLYHMHTKKNNNK